jgi:hypothetical protein
VVLMWTDIPSSSSSSGSRPRHIIPHTAQAQLASKQQQLAAAVGLVADVVQQQQQVHQMYLMCMVRWM